MGESAPFWRFSAASYPDLEETRPLDTVPSSAKRTPDVVSNTSNGVSWFVKPGMKYHKTFPLFLLCHDYHIYYRLVLSPAGA